MLPIPLLTGLFFRFVLPCVLLLSLTIAAVHGQADPVPDLNLLFMPPSCSAPCFLGIEPGQTTLTVGLALLRANALVRYVSPVEFAPDSPAPSNLYDVEFVQTLAFLYTARVQFLTEARTNIIDGILLLKSDIQLSDIALTFGQPAQFVLDNELNLGLVTYVVFYPQYQMYVQDVIGVCAPKEATFWNQRQSLLIGIESPPKYAQQSHYYPTEAHQTGTGWLQQIHDMKRTNCALPVPQLRLMLTAVLHLVTK